MERRTGSLIDVAPFTMATIVICVVAYVLIGLRAQGAANGGSLMSIQGNVLMVYGASWPEGVWDGEWYRFLAPLFLHASLIHIGVNMYSFFHLGPGAEIHFGTRRFAAIFLLSGLGGVCLSQLLGGHLAVGASGSLFGILGAYLAVKVMACYDLRRALKNSDVRRTFFIIILNLVLIGLAVPNIDNWGHVGGLIFGFLYGALFEYQRTRRRLGVMLLVPAILLSLTLVVACRWTYFSPYYHVHTGIKADEAGQTELADRHFDAAAAWSKWFFSPSARDAIHNAAYDAQQRGDLMLRRRYAGVYLRITPEGISGDRRQMEAIYGAPVEPPS